MTSDNSIEILPTELLFDIFGLLDGPPPSDGRLHERPSRELLTNSNCPLKHMSVVSKRWRAIVLPLLFRHVLWSTDHSHLATYAEHVQDAQSANKIPVFAFLLANNLGKHVASVTLIISDLSLALDDAPATLPPPLVNRDPRAAEPASSHATKPAITITRNDYSWLWNVVFDLADPLRLTIIAAPQTLAKLFAFALFVEDADLFDDAKGNFHILSFSRTPKSLTLASESSSDNHGPDQQMAEAHGGALFRIRPWTHLLLNENSSIRVYKNYEYFGKRPPSILDALLRGDDTTGNHPLAPSTLDSFSYVAIFPLPQHFSRLVLSLPRIQHLFVKVSPSSNDILCDAKEMDHVQPSDLWLERDRCLTELVGCLLRTGRITIVAPGTAVVHTIQLPPNNSFSPNWRHLRRFELGDANDQEAWDRFVRPDQFAPGASPNIWSMIGWRIERQGVFVRCAPPLLGL